MVVNQYNTTRLDILRSIFISSYIVYCIKSVTSFCIKSYKEYIITLIAAKLIYFFSKLNSY